jgi:ammonium transporter Rh
MDKGNYLSDIISMIGTLFLFCYWPSFNSAVLSGSIQQRAIINTYLSLATSVVTAIFWSKVIYDKLEMEIILNASIVGGVVMGCNADIIVMPFGAMLTGLVSASFSSVCYGYVQPWVRRKNLFHDTCGVTYLHGIPGIIAGLVSAIVAARSRNNLGKNYGEVYALDNEAYRTVHEQAGFQLACLALCLGLGLFGGLIAGWVTSCSFFEPPTVDQLFDDQAHWDGCVIDHRTLHNLGVKIEANKSQIE